MAIKFVSLTLSGFKSFARKTEFRIAEGLTGIFGANGSGKSSVLDALLWAIGGHLPDNNENLLIFSGNERYPASDSAEVRLRFTRPEGATAEKPYLEVTRRVRKGEASAWRIDDTAIRTQEIRTFLTETGLRPDAPTFLRGGMIEALGTAPASELMHMLELASGIDGLSARRREAQNRLGTAIDRLRQLDRSGASISDDIEQIQGRAEQAQRHATLSRRIHGLNAQLQWHLWHAAERHVDGARMRVKAISARLDSHIALQEKVRAGLNEMRTRTDQAQVHLDKARNDLSGLQLERTRSVGEENRWRSILEHLESHIAYLEQTLTHKDQTLSGLQKIDWPEPVKNAASEQILPSPEPFDEDSARQAVEETRHRGSEAQEALEKAAAGLARVFADKAGIEREHERLALLQEQRREFKQAETEVLSSSSAQQRHEHAKRELSAANNAARQARQRREDKTRARDDTRGQYERVAERVHTLHSQIHGHCAELAVLESLMPTYAPGNENAGSDSSSAPHRLIDLLEINPQLERAVRAALGPEVRASVNMREMEYWSGKTGAVGLYLPDNARPLSELVEAPDWLSRRLSQCGLIKAEDGPRLQAQLQQGQCLVSVEGDMWRWDGLVRQAPDSGSDPDESSSNKQLQIRHSQCEKRLLDTRDELRSVREEKKTFLTRINGLEQELRDASAAEDKALAQLRVANEALPPAEQELERARQVEGHVRKSRVLIDQLTRVCQDTIAGLSEAPAPLQETDPDSAPTEEKARAALEESQTMLEQAQNHKTSVIVSIERARERSRLASLLETRDKQDLSRINSMRMSLNNLCTGLESQKTQLLALLEEAKNQHQSAETDCNSVVDRLTSLDRSIAQASETVQKSERELAALVSECQTQEEKVLTIAGPDKNPGGLQKAESQLEDALVREEKIEKAVKAEFRTDLAGLNALVRALPAEIDNPFELTQDNLAEGQALLQKLLDERHDLGKIDPNAQTQLTALEDKLHSLMAEREELSAAINRLRESLDFLSQSIYQRLLEHFEKVQSQFSTLFQALFGGGSGELRLIGSAGDLNEIGLEIQATPPGKKPVRTGQLSRGERSLTMIAFVFAIFLSRPTPVCVLDQIDESLDPAYQDRFLRLLQGLAKNTRTRMILLSHNTALMSRMDQSYAISMEEAGISSLRKVTGADTRSAGTAAA